MIENQELMNGRKRKLETKSLANKRPVENTRDSFDSSNYRYFNQNRHQKRKYSFMDNFNSDNKHKQTDENDNIHELVVYFEKILNTLKSGLPEESKELFVVNVLKESNGKEVKLSCNSSSSHCIELLLSFCKDSDTWMTFMSAFAKEKVVVCTNSNASHITELLINFALVAIKNWPLLSDDDEELSQTSFFLSFITEFGDFVAENFISCLEDQYASHVACSVIRALGGDMGGNKEFMSKIVMKHKKEFRSQYVDDDTVSSMSLTPVTLENIPKIFKVNLKQISKVVRKMENIYDYVMNGFCATVIEALIFVLGKRSSKQSQKLIRDLSANLLSQRNDNGVPLAFLDKSCSFVVEKIFQASDEDFQQCLWNDFLMDSIEILVQHRVGNYIVQRLFEFIKETSLLGIMCEKIGCLFDKILQSEHYGIFISIATACNQHKAHQALFMQNIIQCLQCEESEEKQLHLIPLLLNFQKYDEASFQKSRELAICLQGSLLVQAIFMFQKPIKLVKSLLNMKPQDLSFLACHIQGCHVLNSFFKSPTVGEKNKDKLIQCLKPVMTSLACDRNGSLTLSRIWVLLSLKQKGAVADILAHNEEILKSNKNGLITFKKFGIFYYKRKYEQWKSMQLQLLQSSGQKTDCK